MPRLQPYEEYSITRQVYRSPSRKGRSKTRGYYERDEPVGYHVGPEDYDYIPRTVHRTPVDLKDNGSDRTHSQDHGHRHHHEDEKPRRSSSRAHSKSRPEPELDPKIKSESGSSDPTLVVEELDDNHSDFYNLRKAPYMMPEESRSRTDLDSLLRRASIDNPEPARDESRRRSSSRQRDFSPPRPSPARRHRRESDAGLDSHTSRRNSVPTVERVAASRRERHFDDDDDLDRYREDTHGLRCGKHDDRSERGDDEEYYGPYLRHHYDDDNHRAGVRDPRDSHDREQRYYPPSSSRSKSVAYRRGRPSRMPELDERDFDYGSDELLLDRAPRPGTMRRRSATVGPATTRGRSVGPESRGNGSRQRSESRGSMSSILRPEIIKGATRTALEAGAVAAIKLRNDPSPWVGVKGSKVAAAALAAGVVDALVDCDRGPKVKKGGMRHTVMTQAAKMAISGLVMHPLGKRTKLGRTADDIGGDSD